MASVRPSSLGLASAAAALGILWALFLPWVLPVDEVVYRWTQSEVVAQVVEQTGNLGLAIPTLLGALFVLAAASAPELGRRTVVKAAVAIGGAALFGELLKTGIERLRPRTVPMLVTGNSFPSGHVMTTTVAALAVCALIAETNWSIRSKRIAYGVALFLALAQAFDRVAAEAHWMSDVPPSVLFGLAWFLATPALITQPSRRLVAGAVFFVVAYAAVYEDPTLRIHLPTASAADSPATWVVAVGDPSARDVIVGAWTETQEEPLGRVAWTSEREASLSVTDDFAAGSIVKLLVRPPDCGQRQRQIDVRMTVSIAHREIAAFGLRRGWREYRFAVPADAPLSRGQRIGLRFDHEEVTCRNRGNPGIAALRYVKIVPTPET